MKKLFALVLVGFLAWGVWWWRDSKERSERIDSVSALLLQGRRTEASEILNGLLFERSNEPEILRLLARFYSEENPERASEALRRLHDSDEATWQDLLLLAEITLDYPDLPPAPQALLDLKKNHGEKPGVVAVLARQDFLEGRMELAMNSLSEVLRKFPDNRLARLQKARIQLLAPDFAARIDAKLTLFELGKANDRVGLSALRVLVNREVGPSVFPEDVLEASVALQRHPLASVAIYLRASTMRLRLEPDRRDEIISGTVERLKDCDKVLLANWLNMELAPQAVLQTLSPNDAKLHPKTFFPCFQALLLLKRFAEARTMRESAQPILDEPQKARADAYLELAEGKKTEAFERFVLRAASLGDQYSLVEAGRLALLGGHGMDSWNAYLRALESGGENIVQPIGLQLLQLALHRRETEVAWRTAKLLVEKSPRRLGNRNNYAYLSLLLNRGVEEASAAIEEAVKLAPLNSAFLGTMALARLREGRFDEALAVMERLGEQGLTPGEQATKVAILLAMGHQADAIAAARVLRSHMMLPEEWSLLGEATPKNSPGSPQ